MRTPAPGPLAKFLLPAKGAELREGKGRKDASKVWSLFTNRKWLLPVHPREWHCPAGSGSLAPAGRVPRMPLWPLSKDQGATPAPPGNSLKIQRQRGFVTQARVLTFLKSSPPFFYLGWPSSEYFTLQDRHHRLLPLTLSLWGSRA